MLQSHDDLVPLCGTAVGKLSHINTMGKKPQARYLKETEKLCDITPGGTDRCVNHFLMFQQKGSDQELDDLFQKGASVLKTMRLGKKQETKAGGAGWYRVNIAGTDEQRIIIGVHFSNNKNPSFSGHMDALKATGVPPPPDTICGELPRTFYYPMKTFYGKIPTRPTKNDPSEERLEELLSMSTEEVRALKAGELTYLCLHYHQQQQAEESDDTERSGSGGAMSEFVTREESSSEESGADNESDTEYIERPRKKARRSTGADVGDSVTHKTSSSSSGAAPALATVLQDALTNWEADAKRRREEMEQEIRGLQVQINDMQKQQADWMVEKEGIVAKVNRLAAEKAVLLTQVNEMTAEKVDLLTRAEADGKKRSRCVELVTVQICEMQKTLDELSHL